MHKVFSRYELHNSAFWHSAGNAAMLTFILTSLRMRIPWKPTLSLKRRTPQSVTFAVWLAWGFSFAVSPLMAQEPPLEGRQVTEVRIVDQAGQNAATAITLPLAPGRPFDIATERESLRQLYATGDYSGIQVTAENEAAGLRINFVAQRNFYNNVIRVLGLKEPPTEP